MTLTRLFSAILLLAFVAVGITARAANNCSATTILGSSCNTDCQAGWHGVCVGGVFSSTCTCVKDGENSSIIRPLPHIGSATLQDSRAFEAWAIGSTSTGLQRLGGMVAPVRNALIAGDVNLYSAMEMQFWAVWSGLPGSDKAAIDQWRFAHGYGN